MVLCPSGRLEVSVARPAVVLSHITVGHHIPAVKGERVSQSNLFFDWCLRSRARAGRLGPPDVVRRPDPVVFKCWRCCRTTSFEYWPETRKFLRTAWLWHAVVLKPCARRQWTWLRCEFSDPRQSRPPSGRLGGKVLRRQGRGASPFHTICRSSPAFWLSNATHYDCRQQIHEGTSLLQ